MARFPAPIQPKAGSVPTVNDAGGAAFDRDPRTELVSYISTSMVQSTYYKSASTQIDTVRALVRTLAERGDLLFAAKAALHARHDHGMRSISHVVAGEVAQLRGEFPAQRGMWGADFFKRIVFRPDDMCEIAGYWIGQYGGVNAKNVIKGVRGKKTLPSAMKKGFALVLANTPEKNLAKYDGASTRSLTLRQLAHLVHPKGGVDSIVYKLRAGKLAAADTHEVLMTQAGQLAKSEAAAEMTDEQKADLVADAKTQAWADLFARGQVKYLAALRNARRIVEQSPECVPALCAKLVSLEDIRGSKVFPFQFLAAHGEVSKLNGPHVRAVLTAIETGAELSLSNVPKLEGPTLVVLDVSGSMVQGHGDNPYKQPHMIGGMFAAALVLANEDCDLILFSDEAAYVTFSGKATLFGLIEKLRGLMKAGGTNFHAPVQAANRAYARMVFLSDMQGWAGGYGTPMADLQRYEQTYGCKPFIYSWDLVGSSTTQFPTPRIAAIAGFSEKCFELMAALEGDPKATIKKIDAIVL